MELSELTNKELKNILRQNNVKNYSKLNKKDLVKKVNQLIKEQNGDKKKYKLNELIGGDHLKGNKNLSQSLLTNQNITARKINEKNKSTIYSRESRGYEPPKINPNGTMVPPPISSSNPSEQSISSSIPSEQPISSSIPSAPLLTPYEANQLRIQEEQRQLNAAKNMSLQNQGVIQKNNLGNNEQCKGCTIL
jgi:hypothetical protein